MNIILLENEKIDIGSMMRKLYDKFPPSSRISINKNNFNETILSVKDRPILTKNWLVTISPRLTIKQIQKVMDVDNINVILLSDRSKLDKLKDELIPLNLNIKVVDNLNPSKEEILEYVMETLDISLADATYLCNRHRMYLPAIVNSVQTLASLDIVDKYAIQEYTRKRLGVNLSTITDNLLGLEPNKKKQIIELIYDYRFGLDYLLKYVLEDLRKYKLVFRLVEEGELSLENYDTYKIPDVDKEAKLFKKISDRRKYNMVKAYSKVSKSVLYFVEVSVSQIKPRLDEVYKLIILLR